MKKTKITRFVSGVLSVALAASIMTGCGNGKQTSNDGEQVAITIGAWPTDAQPEQLKLANEQKAKFEEMYPNIKIKPDTTVYNSQGFMTGAVAGVLPDCFYIAFTEIEDAMKSGYLADLTEYMEKYGYIENLNPSLKDVVTLDDKYYAVPRNVYTLGLMCNRNLFEEAGLVNDDGTIKIPQTFTQLAEYSALIREKTGKAGFAFPTINNHGGWIFMNLAWSNGVKFMEKDGNGDWKATFNSPEMIESLQFISDLKWKYNALQDNGLIDQMEARKLFGTNQAAMYIAQPPENMMILTYKFDRSKVVAGRIPEGNAGRVAQLGGDVVVIPKTASDAQIEAVFKWMEFQGWGPTNTEEQLAALDASTKTSSEQGMVVVGRSVFNKYVGKEYLEKREEIMKKYINVDEKNFVEYIDSADVVIKPEEPVATQQLYEVIDAGIQKVLSDKNADVAATVAEMADKFQRNYLDEQGN